jgi:hypothetical protein
MKPECFIRKGVSGSFNPVIYMRGFDALVAPTTGE